MVQPTGLVRPCLKPFIYKLFKNAMLPDQMKSSLKLDPLLRAIPESFLENVIQCLVYSRSVVIVKQMDGWIEG